MTDLLRHAIAVGQTWSILAILAHVGVSQGSWRHSGCFSNKPGSGMTDLLRHAVAVGETWFILAILAHVGVWKWTAKKLSDSFQQ
jgi:hypothetical protein